MTTSTYHNNAPVPFIPRGPIRASHILLVIAGIVIGYFAFADSNTSALQISSPAYDTGASDGEDWHGNVRRSH